MNVYCKKYDYNNEENDGLNCDYIKYINDDIDENVEPTSSLFDKPKTRPKSLLIYDD